MPASFFMNVKIVIQGLNQNMVTAAFIAVTEQLYVHQSKMEVIAADKEGFAANKSMLPLAVILRATS